MTLVDILASELNCLSQAQRTRRDADHYQVNAIISRTIDAVTESIPNFGTHP